MNIKPSNIKQHDWYEDYVKLADRIMYSNNIDEINKQEYSDIERINFLKERDENVNEISKYDRPLRKILIQEHNTIEKNKEYLEKCKEDLKELLQLTKEYYDLEPNIKNLNSYAIGDYNRCLLLTKYKIEECEKVLKKGYLITNQLEDISYDIENYAFDLYQSDSVDYALKIYDIRQDIVRDNETNDDISYLDSFSFKCNEDEVINIIKQEKNWREMDRDINIYKERQKGRLLKDIAGDYSNLNVPAISRIAKKVESAIGYYKGKLFESEFFKHLKKTGEFDKVEWQGASGEPDIVAHDLKNCEFNIYSLKMRKIDRSPFYISIREMKPELKLALESILEGYNRINLWLIVYDSEFNETRKFRVNFRNPRNIDISS